MLAVAGSERVPHPRTTKALPVDAALGREGAPQSNSIFASRARVDNRRPPGGQATGQLHEKLDSSMWREIQPVPKKWHQSLWG